MKQLSQILALNLFGLNALPILAAIGIAVMLLQMAVKRFSLGKWWKARKANQEIESHLWQIE